MIIPIVEIESYHALPCATKVFKIGDIDADSSDFGNSEDTDWANAEEYGCGSREFIPHKDIPKGVLKRYKIDEDTYRNIQDELRSALYVGSCGWCI